MPASALFLPSTLVHSSYITVVCVVLYVYCYASLQAVETSLNEDELRRLTQDIAETKELCRSLLKHQAEFEQLMLLEFKKCRLTFRT